MIKKYFLKTTLVILTFFLLAIALTGCVDIVVPGNTGTVRITITGSYYYDIKIDGVTRLSNKAPGTYTIPGLTMYI